MALKLASPAQSISFTLTNSPKNFLVTAYTENKSSGEEQQRILNKKDVILVLDQHEIWHLDVPNYTPQHSSAVRAKT